MFENVDFIYLLRIMLAGLCGLIIGFERRNRSKEAGIRTHFVVACGAAIMMVVSKYAFFDVVEHGLIANADIRLDPSRVASTIASGIGFLGAGMIFVHKNTISGLTTAAGIWATSGVGMAIGSGMYIFGIGATFIILIAQYILHIDPHKSKGTKIKVFSVKEVTEEGYQRYLLEKFDEMKIGVLSTAIEHLGEGKRKYTFNLEIPASINEEDLISITSYQSTIKPLK